MRSNKIISALIVGFILIGCAFTSIFSSNKSETVIVSPNTETTLELKNGLKIFIPEEAVIAEGELSASIADKENIPETENDLFHTVGNIYEIELPKTQINKPAVFEFPINTKDIPKDAEMENLFAAYFDEEENTWFYVGGIVDTERKVLIVESDHASLWKISSWNWDAWAAALNKLLSFSIVDAYETFEIMLTNCNQKGSYVAVDSNNANNIIKGCIIHDHPGNIQLQIINQRSYYIEVKSKSNLQYFPNKILSPGDNLLLKFDSANDFPVNVSSSMMGKPTNYFLVDLIIKMMPGVNQMGFQGDQIACITERLADSATFFDVANTLYFAAVEDGSNNAGLSAAESLSKYLKDESAMRRFINAADDCNFGPASTWSPEGIKQIGAASSTILATTDWMVNYFSEHEGSSLTFNWIEPEKQYGEIDICGWQLKFDENIWHVEETNWGISSFDHSQLVHNELPVCKVNCPYGIGLPMSWTLETGILAFEGHGVIFKMWHNEDGNLELVQYQNEDKQLISLGFDESLLPPKDLSPCMEVFNQLVEDSLID